MRTLHDENKWKNAEIITDPKAELMKAIMCDIKRTLSENGFNFFQQEVYLGEPLLFCKDKINEKYLIYAIHVDIEYVDIGYLSRDERNIRAGYINRIYWARAERDEMFSKIYKDVEEIKNFAIEQENTIYLHEAMKPQILFDDVQSVM